MSIGLIRLSGKLNPEEGRCHVGQGVYADSIYADEDSWDLVLSYAENVVGSDFGQGILCAVLDEYESADGRFCHVAVDKADYDDVLKRDVHFSFQFVIESKYVQLIGEELILDLEIS